MDDPCPAGELEHALEPAPVKVIPFLLTIPVQKPHPDMLRAQSREGPITYRFSPRTDGLLDVLVCGELDWNEIRIPGIVTWEQEEDDE